MGGQISNVDICVGFFVGMHFLSKPDPQAWFYHGGLTWHPSYINLGCQITSEDISGFSQLMGLMRPQKLSECNPLNNCHNFDLFQGRCHFTIVKILRPTHGVIFRIKIIIRIII